MPVSYVEQLDQHIKQVQSEGVIDIHLTRNPFNLVAGSQEELAKGILKLVSAPIVEDKGPNALF